MVLIAGLYLAGIPSSDQAKKAEVLGKCPGYQTVAGLIPAVYDDGPGDLNHRWFLLFWAAWFLIISIREIPWARSLFETGFSQCKLLPLIHSRTRYSEDALRNPR